MEKNHYRYIKWYLVRHDVPQHRVQGSVYSCFNTEFNSSTHYQVQYKCVLCDKPVMCSCTLHKAESKPSDPSDFRIGVREESNTVLFVSNIAS